MVTGGVVVVVAPPDFEGAASHWAIEMSSYYSISSTCVCDLARTIQQATQTTLLHKFTLQ